LALKRLGRRIAAVVEPHPSQELAQLALEAGAEIVASEAVEGLSACKGMGLKWVVPTVPVHLVLEWVLGQLPGWAARAVPEGLLPPAPVVIPNSTGGFYLSIATFTCPDDCPQPPKVCTHTRKPRPMNLVEELKGLELEGWRTTLVVSHQLASGIGGIRAEELWNLPGMIGQGRGKWILATACACHAVVDGLGPEGE